MRPDSRTLVAVLSAAVLCFGACSSSTNPDGGGTSGGGCPGGCSAGEVCQANLCVSICVAQGGVVCSDICTNSLTDNANCGSCGTACPQGQACSAGTCATTCAVGYSPCTSDGGSYCANLQGDPGHCGSCDNACVLGDYCSGGFCVMASSGCPTGQTLCDGDGGTAACVNILSDNNNCGGCGAACSLGGTCLGGNCQATASCPSGFLVCPGSDGGAICVAAQIDPSNCGGCGVSCGSNGVCMQGGCACPSLFTQCGSVSAPSCAALPLDPLNCGSCGHACSACENCNLGTCAAQAFLTATAAGIPIADGGSGGYGNLALADFNGDGINDLAAIQGGSVDVFYGSANGFSGASSVSTGASQFGMSVFGSGDFDGNGIADLAVAYQDDTYAVKLILLLGNAAGGFQTLGPFPVTATYDTPAVVATGDFNGDTFVDIAVLVSQGVVVFYNDGSGGLTAVAGLPGGVTGTPQYTGMASGDLNGDGISDLAVQYSSYTTAQFYGLGVLLGSDAGLGPDFASVVATGFGSAVAIGDGEINVYFGGLLQAYGYDSSTGLAPAASAQVPGATTYNNPTYAAMKDMNGDGVVDAVAVFNNSILVWLASDGGYGAPLSAIGGQAGGLAVGDLDGDGRPDVAVSNGAYLSAGGATFLNTCGQ